MLASIFAGHRPKSSHIAGAPPKDVTKQWPLHIKPVRTLCIERIKELAKSSPKAVRDRFYRALRWISPETYECVKNLPQDVRFADIRDADFTDDQLDALLHNLHCAILGKDETPICDTHTFTIPEYMKERLRVIAHTYVTNEKLDRSTLAKIFMASTAQHRLDVLDGEYQWCFDLTASFFQILQHEAITYMQCFRARYKGELRWFRWRKLVMGQRQSVELMHSIMEVLTFFDGAKSTARVYVDNSRFSGSQADVLHDGNIFQDRCRYAMATLNKTTDAPTRSEVFLGVDSNFEHSTVHCAAKTVEKIEQSWAARESWTKRHFSTHMGLLFFTHTVTPYPTCKAFRTLQFLRREIGPLTVSDSDDAWNVPANVWPCALAELQEWTATAIANVPTKPDRRSYRDPDTIVLTDACATGWCFIAWDIASSAVEIYEGEWTEEERKQGTEKSTIAEPLTLIKAADTVLPTRRGKRTVFVTDHDTAVAALAKGHSPSFIINEMVRCFVVRHSDCDTDLRHIPGELNAADRGSREGYGTSSFTEEQRRATWAAATSSPPCKEEAAEGSIDFDDVLRSQPWALES